MSKREYEQDDLIKSLKTNTHKIINTHHEAIENQNFESEFLLSLDRKSSKQALNADESDAQNYNTSKFVNKSIDKDVGRIIISVFINLLVKITPYIKKFKYIHYSSYVLITVNVLYLMLKLNKINSFEKKKQKEDDLIIPININNAILRTEINTNNTNTQSTKSFFKNIETTPLSNRTSKNLGASINNDDKTNAADSSYTLSSKFAYKINTL